MKVYSADSVEVFPKINEGNLVFVLSRNLKRHVCVSSIFLLLLTPSTIAPYSPVCHLGLASMALSSTGLSRTYHPAPSVSDTITLSHPSIPAPVASPKAPFLVLCFSSCTLPPSALSSPPFPSTVTFMQTTPNCFSHFTRPTSTQASTTCKMHFSKSLPG